MKYCSKCGGKIDSSDAFCAFCGAKQAVSIETAIELAKVGDNDGFEYLYNKTYKSLKFYIIESFDKIKDQDIEDIIQDTYLKMMKKINTLNDSRGFKQWLNKIAWNTTIDFIRKRDKKDAEGNERGNINFSDLAVEDADGEIMEYEVEDDNPNWQPEVAYTQKETKELVHAMMENLSDEQRMALIMFHIQGMSIKEIAEIMEVSENTVKSRLNYARKSIKSQGEELRKKGYKLYSFAPLPLLLYLIRLEAKYAGVTGFGTVNAASAGMAPTGAVTGGEAVVSSTTTATTTTASTSAGTVSGETTVTSSASASTATSSTTASGVSGSTSAGAVTGSKATLTASTVAKAGIPVMAKIAMGIAGAAVVVVGTVVSVNMMKNSNEQEVTTEITTEATTEEAELTTEEQTTTEAVTEEETTEEVADNKEILETSLKSLVEEKGYYETGAKAATPTGGDHVKFSDRGSGILAASIGKYINDSDEAMLISYVEDGKVYISLYIVADGEVKCAYDQGLYGYSYYFEKIIGEDTYPSEYAEQLEATLDRLCTEDPDIIDRSYSADIKKIGNDYYLRVYFDGMIDSFVLYHITEKGLVPTKAIIQQGGTNGISVPGKYDIENDDLEKINFYTVNGSKALELARSGEIKTSFDNDLAEIGCDDIEYLWQTDNSYIFGENDQWFFIGLTDYQNENVIDNSQKYNEDLSWWRNN